MNATAHTPTPFKQQNAPANAINRAAEWRAVGYQLVDAGGRLISDLSETGDGRINYDEARELCARIARDHNAHDELVAALRRFVNMDYAKMHAAGITRGDLRCLTIAQEEARAALAKVAR